MVGTGASCMQMAPTLAKEADALTIYQRSAQWARPIPRYHDAISEGAQWLLASVPFYAEWFRLTMLWRYGDGLLRFLEKDPDWPDPDRSLNRVNDRHRAEMTEHIVVELVTEAIDHVDTSGVWTKEGYHRPADIVILATGFEMTQMAARLNLRGRRGVELADEWEDENPKAYLGITVPKFPNLFVMQGPNTGLGHGGSAIFQSECQARYITGLLVQMIERRISCAEVRAEAQDEHIARVDERHEKLIWTHPGMSTYYRNRFGRVMSVSPWRLVDYWRMTHDPTLDEYDVAHRS